MTDDNVTPLPAQGIPAGGAEPDWRFRVMALAFILAATAAVILAVQYFSLRSELDQACAPDSVVARLDLTEWVPLCR